MNSSNIVEEYLEFMNGRRAIEYILASIIFIAIMAVGSVLEVKSKRPASRRRGKIINTTGTAMLLIMLFEYIIRNINAFFLYIKNNNILFLGELYYIFEKILAQNAAYFLLFFPFFILIFDGLRERRMSSWSNALCGVWIFISILIFLNYVFSVFAMNAYPLIYMASIFFVVSLFDNSTISERYSLSSIFSGLRFRTGKVESSRLGFIRMVAAISVCSAYYFQSSVSQEIQVAYYGGLLAGLLGIIGFLALIHGFIFERMKSARIKRMISSDTKAAQGIIGVLIGISIVGMFLSSKSLQFSFNEISSSNFIQHIVFSAAILGGAAAIDYTIRFFHKVVDFVTEAEYAENSTIYLFAEMSTPNSVSSVSTEIHGLSKFSAHLEENGDKVITVDDTKNSTTIRRMRKTVIVIHRVDREIQEKEAIFYRNFIERGNGLLIMADQGDIDKKLTLLRELGFVELHLPDEFRNNNAVQLDISGELEMSHIGSIYPILIKPSLIGLDPDRHKVIHQHQNLERTVFLYSRMGRGLVVVVGSIDHWNNNNIDNADNVLFIDHIQMMFKDFFQNPISNKFPSVNQEEK